MYDELKAYAESDVYPFHMPGHKRHFADDGLPYTIDVTEIDGFDNLHHPSGMIQETEQRAAYLYHAKRAFLLVNGATGGIFAAMKAATKRGDKIIIARNCHTSVYRAAQLLGLKPSYIVPDPPKGDREYDCYVGVNHLALDMMKQSHADVRMVVITSPTYEGICSDIKTIALICRHHHVKLLVDAAHGAHFPFHQAFPPSAMDCAADYCVVSLHKTLPALTQTALLLTNDDESVPLLQSALTFFQTSSPSYVLMSSIDTCLRYVETHTDAFELYVTRLRQLEKELSGMHHLRLLFHDSEEKMANVVYYDISKLVISTYGTALTGVELANILRKNYKIEVEMAALHYIIAMTSVCDTSKGFERLRDALLSIDRQCADADKKSELTIPLTLPECRVYACDMMDGQEVPMPQAIGMTAAEDVLAYPPGIPLIVKGEVIDEGLLLLIRKLEKNGVNIIFSGNSATDSISVADL